MTTETLGRRPVITGLGAINAAGPDVPAIWEKVRAGRSCLSEISRFDASGFPIQVAGEVSGFDPGGLIPPRFVVKTDRFTHFAFVAVDQALADAALSLGSAERSRTGVFFGNNTGGWDICERGFREYYGDGADVVNPWQATAWFLAAPQGFLTIRHGIRGMSKSFSGDRTSGALALYYGARAIAWGKNDTVIAGGCEAPISPLAMSCFHSGGEMSEEQDAERAYRPFDSDASGTVLGEGGAAIVVETDELARRRGARIHATIVGAAHGTALDGAGDGAGDGAAVAYAGVLARALEEAGCQAHDIDLVLCDGSAAPAADRIEVAALARIFPESVPVAVPKAVFGHLYGASFVTDVICGCLASTAGVVPPTRGSGARRSGLATRERPADIRRFVVCARSRYGSCVAIVFDTQVPDAGDLHVGPTQLVER